MARRSAAWATLRPQKSDGEGGRWPEKPKPASIGINSADSSQWEALPGIGPTLASRIVKFRERLGGFHSASQVAETYGLQDSVFMRIQPFLLEEPDHLGRGVDVNQATIADLRSHPYIPFRLAKAIVAYRGQHGPYGRLEDLLSIETMTPDLFRKVSPYLRIH